MAAHVYTRHPDLSKYPEVQHGATSHILGGRIPQSVAVCRGLSALGMVDVKLTSVLIIVSMLKLQQLFIFCCTDILVFGLTNFLFPRVK